MSILNLENHPCLFCKSNFRTERWLVKHLNKKHDEKELRDIIDRNMSYIKLQVKQFEIIHGKDEPEIPPALLEKIEKEKKDEDEPKSEK